MHLCFLWVIVLAFINFASTLVYKKVIIIGDSVDRIMVEEWCLHYNGNLFKDIGSAVTNHSSSSTLQLAVDRYRRRLVSWEIRVCELWQRNVYVTMISNKFGVKPNPPWHMPIRTMSGLEKELTNGSFSLEELFSLALSPGIRILEVAMGGPPDGVLVNSAFWDLSHPDPLGMRTARRKAEWITSWTANVTTLLRIIKDQYPVTKWFGWHTANAFHPYGAKWNTEFALQLLHEMNSASRFIAADCNYDWIDFASYKIVLQDVLHPSPPSLIKLCDTTLDRIESMGKRLI